MIKVGGIYTHYKGKKYRVLQLVKHSETLEDLVYYETLYPCELGQYWVRPAKMWEEKIEVDGKVQSRFELDSQG